MNDVIYRQAAIDALCNDYCGGNQDCEHYPKCEHLRTVQSLPPAQPEIIRCKDCKHSQYWYRDKRRCFLWHEAGIDVFADGFCNYAERR